MQHFIEEYFAKADVFCDYQEHLGDFLSELHMNVYRDIHLDDLLHVFLLD